MFNNMDAASVRAVSQRPPSRIHVTSPPDPSDDSCPNCGQPAMAEYCSRCGEKRRDHADWKLSSIGAEAFAQITDLEHSKLWQTLRLLVFKPGQLTREYWSGRRKRFLGPVKLYVVFFALQLVLYSIHRPTAVYDVRTYVTLDTTGKFGQRLDEWANKRGVPTPQFVEEINSRWQRCTSISQFVHPLLVALALKLLLRRRRLYFAEHLIFALHFLAFIYLFYLVTWPFYVLFGIQTSPANVMTAVSMAWAAVYFVLALRRAYAESWLATVIKGFTIYFLTGIASGLVVFAALALAITLTKAAG